MANQNRGEAYDFTLFEPKRRQQTDRRKPDNVISLPEEGLEKNRRPKHRAFQYVSRCFALLVMLTVIGTYVLGQVRLTELTEGVNQAAKQLEEQKSVHTQLQMKSEAELNGKDVESYAKNVLGMRHVEQGQISYIGITGGDKGEIIKHVGDNWFSDLWEKLQQLLS